MESGSGSEQFLDGFSANDDHEADEQLRRQKKPQPPGSKKKRYHRHTAHQIQEMEALFKECPHPDDKQRQKLSQELGLKPRQVKFWFQNRRTQMKAHQDKSDNVVLRAENDNLKNENYRLQAALRNIMCPNCGGAGMLGELGFDEQQLRLENAQLKEELDRACMLISQYNGRPIQPIGPSSFLPAVPSLELDMGISNFTQKFDTPLLDSTALMQMPFIDEEPNFGTTVLIMENEKAFAMELAITAVKEVLKMCELGQLWTRDVVDSEKEVLNIDEYRKLFRWPVDEQKCSGSNTTCPLRTEATRHSAVVIMNSVTLVDAFLDANKWMELFPSIVARAKTLQIVNSDVTGHPNGSLHLMYAEHQVPSPLVPTREAHFMRFCHHDPEAGIWAVVDFPLDGFQNSFPQPFPFYRKRPSGCIIQDMPNGYSRVTWLEHVEVEENPIHEVFNEFVASGQAFGARRWLALLQRQCQRIASQMARNISDLGVIPSPVARQNVMNLAQRMIRTFCVNMSNSCGQSWTTLSEDTIRITTRKVTGPGEPNGLILTAVSTCWLPYNHVTVFDLLRDEHRRPQFDVLSNGNSLQEVAHIANGSHPGNCISLLRINVASNSSQRTELMLQESCTDESGSLVVYTPIDVDSIQQAMNCDDISCISILPSGFIIHPMPPRHSNQESSSVNTIVEPPPEYGCLLTHGLQVHACPNPNTKLNLSSVKTVTEHLCNAVQQITSVLSNSGDSNAVLPATTDNAADVITEPLSPAALPTSLPDDHFFSF